MSESRPIRVCFWTTTFQGDVWSVVKHLAQDPGFELLVAVDDLTSYRQEPVNRFFPLTCPLIDKSDPQIRRTIKRFRPDVVVSDNLIPPFAMPKLFILWHGFGWKGPNDVVEFAGRHRKIWWRVGSGKKPNGNFRWQCFGPFDLDHRNRVSGFARENLLDLGSAYTDDLLRLSEQTRTEYKTGYGFLFPERPVILFAPTWHYSEVLGHWGDDRTLLSDFFSWCEQRSLNLLFRLHDLYRYDEGYRQLLEELERDHPHVRFKYKNRHRDNLLDIAVADLAISNFSSILNYFYVTGRPSIHIHPVTDETKFTWRRYKGGRLVEKEVDSPEFIWKLPLAENGGMTARSYRELRDQVVAALDEPDCCKDRAERFLSKYFTGVDGMTCNRVAEALRTFAGM